MYVVFISTINTMISYVCDAYLLPLLLLLHAVITTNTVNVQTKNL